MAEDVPDVSTDVIPPGESKKTFISKIHPRALPSSSFMVGPLSGLQHLREHNIGVDFLGCFFKIYRHTHTFLVGQPDLLPLFLYPFSTKNNGLYVS